MTDIREQVLARLLEVVAAIPNVRFAKRNEPDLTEDNSILQEQLPAIIIFDGDEEAPNAEDTSARPSTRPSRVNMTPEIIVIQQAKEAGSDLTTLRVRLIAAILTDSELNNVILKTGRLGNDAIRYAGCQTDFGYGRTLQGGMRAQFIFSYFLRPDDL